MSSFRIEYSGKFLSERKRFVKNNRSRFKDYSKAVLLLLNNPKHPSLHIEKLTNSPFWTLRLNKSDRIFFMWTSKTSALFLDIGNHDKYRKY